MRTYDHTIYMRSWRENNHQKTLEIGKRYYDKNRKLLIKKSCEFRKKHMDRARQYARKSRLTRREAWRGYRLKYEYGITMGQYNEMFLKQNGSCAICLRHQRSMKKTMVVDHDHFTNRVRGLLCQRCNLFIGFLENFKEILPKAKLYLENSR